MWRILAVLTLLFTTGLAGCCLWLLVRPTVTPFLLPGATNIQVVTLDWGQRKISYLTPGPSYAWYFTLAHTLDAEHWILRNRWRPDAAAGNYDPIVPLQFERTYGEVLREEVVLIPDRHDPQQATIVVSQRISIPWRCFWLPATAGRNQQNAVLIYGASR
jgi:hypothetical protein